MNLLEKLNPFSTTPVPRTSKMMEAKRLPLNYGKIVGAGTLLGGGIGIYNGLTSKETFRDPKTGRELEETFDPGERFTRVAGNALDGAVIGGLGGGLLVGGRYLHNKMLPNTVERKGNELRKFIRSKVGGAAVSNTVENVIDPIFDVVKGTSTP